jgi:hypothetical protein
MGIEFEEDQKRKLTELALTACKRRKSSQTGFVHFYPDDPYSQRQDTIPLIENFAFAHALFRSKLMENVQEGKTILEKLLAFEVDGNFPVFLHEYPECRDRQNSSHLLPICFYLFKDFSSVLGDLLLDKLHNMVQRILFYLSSLSEQAQLSKAAESKRKAYLQCFDPNEWEPASPSEWGEYWMAYQMMENMQLEANALEKKIRKYWDPAHFVFIGPWKERAQDKDQPAVTLLDLFMGEYFKAFSMRALQDHPCHLKASLVYPFSCSPASGEATSFPYTSLIEKNSRQCLTLFWGGELGTHSFTLESKKGSWEIQKQQDRFELTYTFCEEVPGEDENVEFAFYLNDSPLHAILINGQKGTMFHLQDRISIRSEKIQIELLFSQKSGEGSWTGHLSKANRSFQKHKENPYACFDWKIGLRTLRRIPYAQIRIVLDIRLFAP